jgi:hypothetical protein
MDARKAGVGGRQSVEENSFPVSKRTCRVEQCSWCHARMRGNREAAEAFRGRQHLFRGHVWELLTVSYERQASSPGGGSDA